MSWGIAVTWQAQRYTGNIPKLGFSKQRGKKQTIHESDQDPPLQNSQESSFQRVQHSRMGNEYMHRALTHFQTSNQIPEKTKENV